MMRNKHVKQEENEKPPSMETREHGPQGHCEPVRQDGS